MASLTINPAAPTARESWEAGRSLLAAYLNDIQGRRAPTAKTLEAEPPHGDETFEELCRRLEERLYELPQRNYPRAPRESALCSSDLHPYSLGFVNGPAGPEWFVKLQGRRLDVDSLEATLSYLDRRRWKPETWNRDIVGPFELCTQRWRDWFAGLPGAGGADPADGPRFDRDELKLWCRGRLQRRFSPRAKNCIVVLRSFQELNWPRRMDDPDNRGANATRVQATAKSLNAWQVRGERKTLPDMRFGGDGAGTGYRWAPAESGE